MEENEKRSFGRATLLRRKKIVTRKTKERKDEKDAGKTVHKRSTREIMGIRFFVGRRLWKFSQLFVLIQFHSIYETSCWKIDFFDIFVKILCICPTFFQILVNFCNFLFTERLSSKLDGFKLRNTVFQYSKLIFYVFFWFASKLTKIFKIGQISIIFSQFYLYQRLFFDIRTDYISFFWFFNKSTQNSQNQRFFCF